MDGRVPDTRNQVITLSGGPAAAPPPKSTSPATVTVGRSRRSEPPDRPTSGGLTRLVGGVGWDPGPGGPRLPGGLRRLSGRDRGREAGCTQSTWLHLPRGIRVVLGAGITDAVGRGENVLSKHARAASELARART